MMANLSRLLWLLPMVTITAAVSSDAIAIASTGTIAENAIAQGRIRAPFFEETQDPGFTNTFLRDALGGVADPLESSNGSSAAETITTGSDSLQTIQNNFNRSRGDLNGGPSPRNGRSIVTPDNGRIPTGRGIFRSLPPSGR
ncbi:MULTISPECIES: hypothetical protein [Limnospira]|uniref:Uncharacterized protein n=2 Tax=Limnospira TaxID=2596745 RepID=A0A9P1KDN7_9CYAN|nr:MULTISPECIES: hypothetical protein [Limnospira]RAQ39465.1 hypothetical protein B9S53_21580 [Arthrospira sp. O9.13F]MDT9188991.1 hypothetical protein [Limnospira sp. PMC 894.15]MDT9234839.1 hypothetical protein [Limnospira sp. PMC 917.15]MDT9276300.1 hypothetical protein [Limnospira sp. PMC 737.11]CDM93679.1 hypothetical protein ARTHRO_11352 [Limnospira indica PCC 8005]